MIKTKFSRAISAVMSRAKLIAVVLAAIVLVSTFPVQFIKAVSIEDGDKQFMVYSFGTDTKTILSSASIEVDEADEITVALEEKENCDLTIKIKRAFPITITVGEETRTMEVCSGTVADAINEFGFIGIYMGGFKAGAVGTSAALIFGYLASWIFEPKMKK